MRLARVGFTTTSYLPAIGGAQLHHHEIAKQLLKRGIQISVVTAWTENRTDWLLGTTIKAPKEPKEYVQDGIPILQPSVAFFERIALFPGALLYPILPELASPYMATIWRNKFAVLPKDVELIHNIRIGREHLTEASLQLARERNIPFVLTPNHSPRMNKVFSRRLFSLYRSVDFLFAFTEVERQQLIALGVRPDRIGVIGVGPLLSARYDAEAFRRKYGIEGKMVLFLGQKYKYKGYASILESAPLVWEKFPDTYFVFIGPNYPESKSVFDKYQDPRIINLGALPPFSEEKASAIAACDVFCLPSRQEGFGGVFVEAWSFKKPVIGGDIPPLREVIRDGVDGYLVPQHPNVLADRITRLLGDPARAEDMGAAGWEKVQKHYRWEVVTEAVIDGYERAFRNFHG